MSDSPSQQERLITWLPAFGVTFLCFLFYLLLYQDVRDYIAAQEWQPTSCTILESELERREESGSEASYRIKVRYEYTWAGKSYFSNKYSYLRGASNMVGRKKEIVKSLSPGTVTTCFVNPKSPQQAMLNRAIQPDFAFALIGLGSLLLFYGALFFVQIACLCQKAVNRHFVGPA